MGCTNTVGACITATDDQHVFSLGSNALVFREFHTSQHAVLLREQFEGEMNAL